MVRRRPRLVVDAKATTESLEDWVGQCGSYCHELNKRFDSNPADMFVLTNGVRLALYAWDKDSPLLELNFEDFNEGKRKYQKLQELIGEKATLARIRNRADEDRESRLKAKVGEHLFRKEGIDEINSAFAWCHQYIYRKDNLSQAAAFNEFIKLTFLKLLSDKRVHEKYHGDTKKEEFTVPADDVSFSTSWIEKLEPETDNPVADISFVKLRKLLEDEITEGRKKRMFDPDETLSLSPETIKGVIEKLENIDLYSIDHDLNGRLFETFLNATMRGKDLGQYFTPRSVVQMMIQLSALDEVNTAKNCPIVLDPCCGSGGFLIDALATLWRSTEQNQSLSDARRNEVKYEITQNNVIGLDIGRDPPIARIARINMYLHGDGGSRIFQADALDKSVTIPDRLSPEKKQELRELASLVNADGLADVILTNPPFSKVYQSKHEPEKKILSKYECGTISVKGNKTAKSSVKSSILFLERYWEFLKTDGRVIAIVDDSILGSKTYKDARVFIRRKYIIEAVISLPGDAFQRSKARVKTSVIVLRKKTDPEESQPGIFMYYCTAVGVDDSPRQRSLPIDRENRKLAQDEIRRVSSLYRQFKAGKAKKWVVPGKKLTDRMDVKSCLPRPERLVPTWKRAGTNVLPLHELVDVFDEDNLTDSDVLYTADSEERVTFLRIRYDGWAERGDEIEASGTNYSVLLRVRENDIVISNINAVHGAIAVVPASLDGCVVSNEFTICRARRGVDPKMVWLLARSPEARSDLVVLASGIGRTRVRWENARNLKLPIPKDKTIEEAISHLRNSEELLRQAEAARTSAETLFNEALGLDNEEAWNLIKAFKPPK
jgi:type I restriction enzyme M protein